MRCATAAEASAPVESPLSSLRSSGAFARRSECSSIHSTLSTTGLLSPRTHPFGGLIESTCDYLAPLQAPHSGPHAALIEEAVRHVIEENFPQNRDMTPSCTAQDVAPPAAFEESPRSYISIMLAGRRHTKSSPMHAHPAGMTAVKARIARYPIAKWFLRTDVRLSTKLVVASLPLVFNLLYLFAMVCRLTALPCPLGAHQETCTSTQMLQLHPILLTLTFGLLITVVVLCGMLLSSLFRQAVTREYMESMRTLRPSFDMYVLC